MCCDIELGARPCPPVTAAKPAHGVCPECQVRWQWEILRLEAHCESRDRELAAMDKEARHG